MFCCRVGVNLQPLIGGVDARQCCDGMPLLCYIVHKDVDVPLTDEVDVDVVPGFRAGTVVGR